MEGLKERRFLNDLILKESLNVKSRLDWRKILKLASQNRVLYFLLLTLPSENLEEKPC